MAVDVKAVAAAAAVDTVAATGTTRLLEDMADPLTTITPAANMLMGRHRRRGFRRPHTSCIFFAHLFYVQKE